MKSHTLVRWLAAGVLTLLALPHAAGHTVLAAALAPKVLHGTVPQPVAAGTAQLLGTVDPSQTLSITVGLQMRNEAALQSFLQDVNNPASPRYHQYLDEAAANDLFNPTADGETRVVNWLQSHGLSVTHTYPNHLLVDAQGSAADVQKALSISLKKYRGAVHGKAVDFFAPSTDPTVDGSVSGLISNVVGLDNVPRFHLSSNGTAHGSPAYYPQDFANAYDVNPLWNAGYTGTGQHIGITLWETPPSDATLNSFGSTTGAVVATRANGRLNVIPVDGGTTTADDGEAGMDIESSSGMAPAAKIDYYEAPTDASGNPTDQGLLDALNAAGTDANNNYQITSSWGGCEASSATDAWTTSAENIFAANEATGHTYFFSTGDNASWCDPLGNGTGQNPYPDYPSSSPNVTAVGGTRFSGNVGSTNPGEVAWQYCATCASGSHPLGSGGGYSKIFSRPTWQTASTLAANGMRGYPDISAVGDPATGAYICYGSSSTTCGQIGGTSLSSPLWAGITALLNQYATANGKSLVGQLDSTLYRYGTASPTYRPFLDVTSGTNGGYTAGTGWDAVTGWGTPDAWNLARDLAGASSPSGTPTSTSTVPTNTPTPIPPAPTSTSAPTSTPVPTTTQLVSNPGFESGMTPWAESSANGYELLDSSMPHSGLNETWFCGYNSCNDQVWQTATLPAQFSSLTLGYWVFIKGSETSTACNDSFTARIRTTGGTTITSAPVLCNSNATGGWIQKTVDVTSALGGYGGKQVQVAFQGLTNTTNPTSFYLDDVSLTAVSGGSSSPTNTPAPTATATKTATPTVTPVPTATNTPVPAPSATPTGTAVPAATPTNTAAPTATTTHTPAPTGTPTGTPVSSTPTQLVTDNSFENSSALWRQYSVAGYGLLDSSNPHTGIYDMWFCGYNACNDQLRQTITVPVTYSWLTLSYWVHVTTQEVGTLCGDSFISQLQTTAGASIGTAATTCNSDATGGWIQKSVDVSSLLSAYKGNQVQIYFGASGNASGPTSFYLDDVSLLANGSAGGSPPPTSTPTPAPTNTPVSGSTQCIGATTQSACIQYELNLLNTTRSQNGVAPLTLNMTQSNGTGSCVGSYGHSTAMAQSGNIWHTNPSFPAASFPTNICVSYSTAGENVGMSQSSSETNDLQTLHNSMMSEAHDALTCATQVNHACNILNSRFTQVGIGIYYVNNTTWLTTDFVG